MIQDLFRADDTLVVYFKYKSWTQTYNHNFHHFTNYWFTKTFYAAL